MLQNVLKKKKKKKGPLFIQSLCLHARLFFSDSSFHLLVLNSEEEQKRLALFSTAELHSPGPSAYKDSEAMTASPVFWTMLEDELSRSGD